MWGDDSEFCFDTFDPGPYHRKANTPSAIDQFRAATVQRPFANVITSASSHFLLPVGAKHKNAGNRASGPITARQGHCGTHFDFTCICKKALFRGFEEYNRIWVGDTATAKNQNSTSQALWVSIHPSTELPK